MAEHSMYHCVSLWALTEVLGAFSPEELTKIQISWYKDYFGEKRSFILQSPETCPVCGRQVMELLDQYRDTQDAQIVLKLKTYPCRCREKMAGRSEPAGPGYPHGSGGTGLSKAG